MCVAVLSFGWIWMFNCIIPTVKSLQRIPNLPDVLEDICAKSTAREYRRRRLEKIDWAWSRFSEGQPNRARGLVGKSFRTFVLKVSCTLQWKLAFRYHFKEPIPSVAIVQLRKTTENLQARFDVGFCEETDGLELLQINYHYCITNSQCNQQLPPYF